MQVYSQEDALIERWQWNDPALRNLSDVVIGLLAGLHGRVLDLGCGTGRLACELAAAGFSVDGIDVEERAVQIGRRIVAQRNLDVHLYTGDVHDPTHPVAAGGYDVVVCTEVLEHVGPWRELLVRAGELLRPGGTLVVSVPRDPHQYSVLDTYAGHVRRFRDEELIAALGPNYEGITVRRLGFPSMRAIVFAYTTLLKLSRGSHAQQSQQLWREPNMARRLALALFYRLLKLDNLFAGLPFGTTLVVRARKRA
ncbi:MAG TPA: class I SAM-dependent methyltransferase [Roseiflexaceae bacterium]|nr:class I SAM-dependent methyltransferase [Roseiflexaceae bacterium]